MTCERRDFLRIALSTAALTPMAAAVKVQAAESAHPAAHWTREKDKTVRCGLCPRSCFIREGSRGHCLVRENRGGELTTLVYGNPCSINNDPIEKKPFFHVLPGRNAFSIATVGCNIHCLFCQNWEISQFRPDQVDTAAMTPDEVVEEALRRKTSAIAFTYSEPNVWFEYMRDICIAAKGTPLKRVLVSNGYINEKPQAELLGLLDAVKIDFKSFSESFYTETCGGHLKPVLDSLERIKKSGIWLEMVVLVIPTLNDNERELTAMAKWVMQKLGPDVPLHFTRFHPMYKLENLPPTPIATLEKARNIAMKEGIHFVYAGNVPGHPGENTYCPSCKTMLIERDGYTIIRNQIKDGKCARCGAAVPGVWK